MSLPGENGNDADRQRQKQHERAGVPLIHVSSFDLMKLAKPVFHG
jgi:hypothetical protein